MNVIKKLRLKPGPWERLDRSPDELDPSEGSDPILQLQIRTEERKAEEEDDAPVRHHHDAEMVNKNVFFSESPQHIPIK